MKVAYISDIHMDFTQHTSTGFFFEYAWDVLVIAGDTGDASQMMTAVDDIATMCYDKHIIVITGNHEYYDNGETIYATDLKIQAWADSHNNVSFLRRGEMVNIHGVNFIGATLWTDFGRFSPSIEVASTLSAYATINDFMYINASGGGLSTKEVVEMFDRDRKGIVESLSSLSDDDMKNTVVITHFSPTISYNNEHFPIGPIAYYFSATMDDVIEMFQPAYWISGHTHSSRDLMEYGETALRSNQYHPIKPTLKFFDI